MRPNRWSRGVRFIALFAFILYGSALADTPQCLISFDAAKLDVCNDHITLVNEDLWHLADQQAFADSNIRIVKFDGPITSDQRDALIQTGAEILGYVPFYGYKVRMHASLDSQARGIPGVIWTGPYLPVWKVSVNLANDLKDGRILTQADHIDSLWVSLHRGVSANQARGVLDAIPGTSFRTGGREDREQEFVLIGFERGHLASIVTELAANEDVNAVSFHWPVQTMNSQGTWLHQSGEHEPEPQLPIFERGIFGCGQVMGMLDTGLHSQHCSYNDPGFGAPVSDTCASGAGCNPIDPDFGHRKVGAHYKWSGLGGAPGDGHGHGTAVAGNMLGNNLADAVDCENFTTPGGLSDLDGMAPGAKLIAQEAGPSLNYLNTQGGTLYHAALVAYENEARIHNNSWGQSCVNQNTGVCIAGCEMGYREHSRGGDQVVWENPDLLVFVAAGNDATRCPAGQNVGAPGNAKNVFSIGGTQRGTSGNNMYTGSSRGPTIDRRTKPDLLAQSQSVRTSSVSACGVTNPISGTSFGSPTAAGLAALVREYLQRGFYPQGVETEALAIENPSAALIKAMMITGAHEIDGTGTNGTPAPSEAQGWGRVLLDNALYFEGDDRRLWLHDGVAGLETGDLDTHELTVDAGEPLTVTLVWHDFPAGINVNPHIVNELRLEVEAPSGEIWTQKLSPGGGLADPNPFQDTTTDDYDDRNTVHKISFDAPAFGTYQVRVRGINVAMGDTQPYALAATGNLLGVGDPDFVMQPDPTAAAVCLGDDAVFDIGVLSIADFDDPVTLSVTDGLPAGANANFSVNPVAPAAPAAVSVLTVSGGAAGDYTLELTGASSGPGFDPATHTRDLPLTIAETLSGPGLLTPGDGEADVDLQPTFAWDEMAGAVEYRIEVATDAGFGNLVIDEVLEQASFVAEDALTPNTAYFWRVRGINACGDGAWSATFEFETRLNPIADVSPGAFEFVLGEGTGDSDVLTIGNIGTDALEWSIVTVESSGNAAPRASASTTMVPPATAGTGGSSDAAMDLFSARGIALPANLRPVTPAGSVIDCDNAPGIIIHDDGTIEAGYSGNPDAGVNEVRFVDYFEPDAYPASFRAVCVAFLSVGPSELDIDVLVYADDGPAGSPGTELGVLSVTVDVPVVTPPDFPTTWSSIDISSLDISVESGGVFIGVRWSPLQPVFIAADLSDDRPVGYAGGYWWNNNDAEWDRIQNGGSDAFAAYRSLFVRAATGSTATSCDDPATISWLDVTPASGSTAPGNNSEVDVLIDTDGLAAGEYSAALCIESNDPTNPVVVVPVSLTVLGDVPIADITPGSLDFEVPAGGSGTLVLDIGNIGELDLDWDIMEAEVGAGHILHPHNQVTIPPTAQVPGNIDGFAPAVGVQGMASHPFISPRGDQMTITHSQSKNVLAQNSVACTPDNGQTTSENQFLRVFTLSDFDIDHDFEVTNVAFGIEVLRDNPVAITVNLYTLEGSFIYANLTQIGTATESLSAQELTVVDMPVFGTAPAGSTLVVEIVIPDLTGVGAFFPGSNSAGETAPSYLASASCNVHEPATFASIGQSSVHLVMTVTGQIEGEPDACDNPTDIPWLSVDPTSGTTPPGDSVPVNVTANAAGMSEGHSEQALLCVATNDPTANMVEIPVSLTVTEGGPPVDEIFDDRFEVGEE